MITTVVLAGGLGRRFNLGDKLTFKLEGKTLIEHVVETAFKVSDQVIVAVDNTERAEKYGKILRLYDVAFALDNSSKARTPMRGILAGVKASQGDRIIIIPGDAAYIRHETIRLLVEPLKYGFKAVSPITPAGEVQTLFQAVDGEEARRNAELLDKYGWLRADGLLRLSESQLYVAFEEYGQFKTVNKPEDMVTRAEWAPSKPYARAVCVKRKITLTDVEPSFYWIERLVEYGEYFLAGVIAMQMRGETIHLGVEAFLREAARYLGVGVTMMARHAIGDASWLQRQV